MWTVYPILTKSEKIPTPPGFEPGSPGVKTSIPPTENGYYTKNHSSRHSFNFNFQLCYLQERLEEKRRRLWTVRYFIWLSTFLTQLWWEKVEEKIKILDTFVALCPCDKYQVGTNKMRLSCDESLKENESCVFVSLNK